MLFSRFPLIAGETPAVPARRWYRLANPLSVTGLRFCMILRTAKQPSVFAWSDTDVGLEALGEVALIREARLQSDCRQREIAFVEFGAGMFDPLLADKFTNGDAKLPTESGEQ